MTPADFQLLSGLVKDRSGLVLTEDKIYLLESRLMPLARRWNASDLAALCQIVRAQKPDALLRDITEAMTTNESFFFRDITPFDRLRDVVLPTMVEARKAGKKIRIWSAASSSGQEAYSIAMMLKENAAKFGGVSVEILGTDLSNEMVERARSGTYTQFEVQRGLPVQMLMKYFKQDGDKWMLAPEIKSMVQFRQFNLLDGLAPLGTFDIVFCRNVLIYFDQATKSKVLGAIRKQMPDDGFLFLGGAETVLGITDKFKPIQGERGIYAIADKAGVAMAAAS